MSKRANGDGGIYRRASDGRWVGVLDLGRDVAGRRRRHVVYGQLRREAAAKLDEARKRLAADEPVKDARTTMAAFVEDWIRKALPASGRKPHARELCSHCSNAPHPSAVWRFDA
jgi:hypothetical protein